MKAIWLEEPRTSGALSMAELLANGIYYARLDTDSAQYQGQLDALKSERGYVQQDEIALSEATPNLDALCAKFVDEHFHEDDEVRFVLDGEGVFDIRSGDDRWIRVVVERGDLIVVPAQRHHRFLMTEQRRIRCVRLFKDAAGWVPHYRG